jgi:hypothetical protein
MRISWAIPCRYAEELNGLGNLLGAGWDVFRPATLPTELSIGLAVNVVVPEHELGVEQTMNIETIDPTMVITTVADVPFMIEDYAHRPPARQPSRLHVFSLALIAEQYGIYTVNLRLQDNAVPVQIFVERPLS